MRRQTVQPFFIRLIIVVSLILKCTLSASTTVGTSGAHPPSESNVNQAVPLPPPPKRSSPPTPSPKRPPSSPPTPSPKRPPSSPPTPFPKRPPPSPPLPSLETHRGVVIPKRVGKVVGFLFLGISGVLQVGVISFLVFKRWQIPRIQDEAGVHLVS